MLSSRCMELNYKNFDRWYKVLKYWASVLDKWITKLFYEWNTTDKQKINVRNSWMQWTQKTKRLFWKFEYKITCNER